ncbi:FtsX-like permease family protein [Romboutsia sp. 1001216sp1]|uniref:FtsX-like permease family protein n=1 Tax=unclassified Romboutsia TaxID=2626894 RepID=UPI00189E4BD7|nr:MULTISPECIES: FtsX-like permease family protein [unclassified Romboutsia]MDB8790044.1 FtsX-like permease family protein [Romboutsia sp. 1001216sp1]MDB8802364.1 FtsX-like permease family protein [Romboutsia sp. 1001216sp1]MDB8813761.1 FtsX-like permease family protein [Romboutsia sp. 1001216sp1]
MYSKIAIGNVKKSFKDYAIYFLTLTLAVSIFYSFNSIESQKAILEMNNSTMGFVDTLSKIIGGISVFVSFILGSLIVYANNFLIKKRKKELGIYMTLGMGKGKISKILILETLIVGVISLASGLILGLIMSQGLSLFTSKLFEVNMSEYKFIFSTSAIIKTIIYFGIIFLIVMAFNVIVISRYKIIDLLTAGKKNENIRFKNPIIYLITFILCLISIGTAYKLILDVKLNIEDIRFSMSIGLGVVGTFLFFYSLAGFGLYIFKNSKNIYFRGLNIFITKQINSKVNTNFISMSIICLMLFLTMGMLSTGIGFKNALEKGLEKTTPFDASARVFANEDDKIKSIKDALNNLGFKFNDKDKYLYYNTYDSGFEIKNLNKGLDKENQKNLNKIEDIGADFIKISEYNDIRKLEGKKSISLGKNEVLIMSNNNMASKIINNFLENNKEIKIDKKNYKVKNEKAIEDSLHTTALADNMFTIVVNDDLTNKLQVRESYLNVNFGENSKNSEEKLSKLFDDFKNGKIDYKNSAFIYGETKVQVYAESKGMTTIMLFIGIYLGIIFLISSMAVLALQQLSEASDSIERYKSLRRIGANDKMINKSIFIQTLIYFSLPIVLAFIHSIVGIKVSNEFIAMYGKPDIGLSSLVTALIFVFIYVGYFYATYTGYKNIVKNS